MGRGRCTLGTVQGYGEEKGLTGNSPTPSTHHPSPPLLAIARLAPSALSLVGRGTHLGLFLPNQRLYLFPLCFPHRHQIPILSLSKFMYRIQHSLALDMYRLVLIGRGEVGV